MGRQSLGDFEHLSLLAVMRLGNAGFGLAIRDEIVRLTDRDVSTGAIYTTLDRLERKGLLRSTTERDQVDDKRVRRRYEITRAGREAVVATQNDIRALSRGLSLHQEPH